MTAHLPARVLPDLGHVAERSLVKLAGFFIPDLGTILHSEIAVHAWEGMDLKRDVRPIYLTPASMAPDGQEVLRARLAFQFDGDLGLEWLLDWPYVIGVAAWRNVEMRFAGTAGAVIHGSRRLLVQSRLRLDLLPAETWGVGWPEGWEPRRFAKVSAMLPGGDLR